MLDEGFHPMLDSESRPPMMKIKFGQARERKQLQWRESFNVFSGVGFRCGSKRGKKNVVSMVSHTFG